MPEEFSTELISSIPRVEGVMSFRFHKPSDFNFKAGQFFVLTIFQGQAEEMTKHFSFSSSPTEDYLEFTTRMTGSDFKNSVAKVKPGDEVIIKAPYGQFVLDEEAKLVTFLVGGIGVTPARSISKYCTDKKLDNNIIVLYGNRSADQITFKEDFDQMEKQNPKLKVVHVISIPDENWKGHTGHNDQAVIDKEVEDIESRIFYISGPPGMVTAMRGILEDIDISSENIHQESFTGYT